MDGRWPGIAVAALAALVATTTAAARPQPAPAQAAAPVPPLVREGVTQKVSGTFTQSRTTASAMVPNVGIIVGSRATLVVDTGLGPNGETVMREVAKVSRRRLYLVTTHVHPEHDLGAGAFPAAPKMIRSRTRSTRSSVGPGDGEALRRVSPLHAELLQGAEFRRPTSPSTRSTRSISVACGCGSSPWVQPHARRHGDVRRADGCCSPATSP